MPKLRTFANHTLKSKDKKIKLIAMIRKGENKAICFVFIQLIFNQNIKTKN